MNRYKTLERLGDGSFGEVTKAQNLKSQEIVAIKKIKALFPTWEECLQLRELKALRVLRHENIIQLKEVIRDKEELYFVFEYMKSSLFKVMRQHSKSGQATTAQRHEDPSSSNALGSSLSSSNKNSLSSEMCFTEAQIRSIMYQLFCGLAHMHKHGFFHRDIKPENLLCHDETLKIADLGQAREIRSRPPYSDYVATRWYRSPELLLRSSTYNSPIDLWACGCIMAELYLQSPLFPGSSEVDQMCRICKVLGTPTKENWSDGIMMVAQMQFKFPKCQAIPLKTILPPSTSKAALQLIQELLQYDPSRRLTAAQALQHRFFDQQVPRAMLTTSTSNSSSSSHVSSAPVAIPPLMTIPPLKAEYKSSGFSSYCGCKGDDMAGELTARRTRKDGMLNCENGALGSSRKPTGYDITASSCRQSKYTELSIAPMDELADAKATSKELSSANHHEKKNGWSFPISSSTTVSSRTNSSSSTRKLSPSPEESDNHQHYYQHRAKEKLEHKDSDDHLLQDLLDEFLA